MSEFLVEAARNSHAIAASLTKLRQRAEAAIRDAAIADTVLDARDAAKTGGTGRSSSDAAQPRTHAPSAGLDMTRSADAVKSWGSDLLRDVAAPDVFAAQPLNELELLALRSAQALRTQGARLRQMTFLLAALGAAVVGAGLYAGVQGEVAIAGGLLAFGLLVLGLVLVKWNPFRRSARSAELAELADATATTLRLRMRALEEIPDTKTRTLEQWKVVIEMTESVRRHR
jgi:hypothetical protein